MNLLQLLLMTIGVAVSLQVARTWAQNGGNSNTDLCQLQRCLSPAVGDTPRPEQSEEDAIIRTRCYTACIEDIGIPLNGASTVWPSVSLSSLITSCTNLSLVLDCTRGCVTEAKTPSLGPNQCRDACFDECQSVSVGVTGDCSVSCRKSNCKRGCLLPLSTTNTDFASRPVQSPELLARSLVAGVFDISYTVPETQRNNTSMTGFVFRVESSNGVGYYSQTSLSDSLNLSFFACQTVNVSFAAINTNGPITSLTYSPPYETCIHGETFLPAQPASSSISFPFLAEDFREDLVGAMRAKVNVSWERPDGFEYLSHYKLTFRNINADKMRCGPDKVITVDREATSFLVTANDSNDSPTFGNDVFSPCTYIVYIQSHPTRDPDSLGTSRRILNFGRVRVTTPTPSLELHCSRDVNSTTGNITAIASWTVDPMGVEEPKTILESLDFWLVSVEEFTRTPDGELLRGRLILTQSLDRPGLREATLTNDEREVILTGLAVNQDASGLFVAQKLSPKFEPNLYRIQIAPHRKREFWFRNNLVQDECMVNITPTPPRSVDPGTMSVDAVINEDNITMSMTWEQPRSTFGQVSKSSVRVTTVPVTDDSLEAQEFVVFTTSVEDTNSTVFVVDDLQRRIEPDVLCVFVQVQTSNQFNLISNWSDPLPVPRNGSVTENCTLIILPDLVTNDTTTSQAPQTTIAITEEVSEEGLPSYVYGAIGAGAGVLLALLMCLSFTVCACVYLQRRRQMRKSLEGPLGGPMWISGTQASEKLVPMTMTNLVHSRLLEDGWEIPSDHIILEEEIGEGCFGMVHRGMVKGPLPGCVTMKTDFCRNVAIKFLKPLASSSEKTDFLNEIDLMKKIASGNNPHVLALIGCVTTHEPLSLITEFLVHGSLIEYLHTIRKLIKKKLKITNVTSSEMTIVYKSADSGYPDSQQVSDGQVSSFWSPQSQPSSSVPGPTLFTSISPPSDSPYANLGDVEEIDLLSFAYQISSGMQYLASIDIIHRDLACRNVLVSENKTLKISDFGMSRVVDVEDPVYVKTGQGRLPMRWMAIESIREREFTSASDVWSYGVTLWEIASLGGFPYAYVGNEDLLDHLKGGHRLDKPNNCSDEIYQIMTTCWAEDPNYRQSFPQLKSTLGDMLLESRQYIQFSDADLEVPLGYDHLATADDLISAPHGQLLAPDPTLGQQRLSWNAATRLPATMPLAEVGSAVNFTGESGFSEQYSGEENNEDHEYSRSVGNRYVLTPHKKDKFGFGVRNATATEKESNLLHDKAEDECNNDQVVVKQENGAVLNNAVGEEMVHNGRLIGSELEQEMPPYDHLNN